MIEFINLSKKFKNNFWENDFWALDNVSFRINEGDLVGFLGANGAGKTTLIKCLMDFSRPTKGKIIFDPILMGSNPMLIKSQIGYLPERAYLYQHLTGREFLKYTSSLNSVDSNSVDKTIEDYSEKIKIAYALDQTIRSYSKGMQQRLGFVSALLHKPRLLVLDEPLSGLDPIGRHDFKRILKELNQQGITIFFSSHIVSDVEELCNKVIFIEKGRLVYNGNVGDLISKHSNDNYDITYVEHGLVKVEMIKEEEKMIFIKNLLERHCNILSIEKNRLTLEEIIYKTKK